jgi:hypothetical protein
MFAIESHALACNVTELYQPFAALGMWLAVGLCTREHRGMLQWITLPSWILKLNDAGFQIDLSSDALASGLDPLLCAEKILIQNAHWPPAFAVLTMARPSPGCIQPRSEKALLPSSMAWLATWSILIRFPLCE